MSENNFKNVLVISGPTGSGENTLSQKLMQRYPIFKKLVAATTRKMREGEVNLVDYYFFSKDRFFDELKKGNIIEYTHITNRDDYYGTYKPDLEDKIKKGFNVIATPDVIGTKYFKKNYNATAIFIKAESSAVLSNRLKKRNPSMTDEDLKKRLENAKKEIEDEEPFYDYVVVNKEGKLNEAVEDIVKIIKRESYKLE